MLRIEELKSMKNSEKISVVTCYDYSFAKILDGVVDIALVGDSLGMVLYGADNTREVTVDDMARHVKAVKRGMEQTLVVADMPYRSYDDPFIAVKNGQILVAAGADAVKPENEPEIVEALVKNGIPVMAHIGLTPQTIDDYKIQGREKQDADRLIKLAKELEAAGAFSLVIECVPANLAKEITETVSIPTIGIGAGKYCDGQVLVLYDILGLYDKINPRFVKRYADLKTEIVRAIRSYSQEVKQVDFPGEEHSFR